MIPQNIAIQIETNERKCGRCDKQIPRADWNFCPYCGLHLGIVMAMPETEQKPEHPYFGGEEKHD